MNFSVKVLECISDGVLLIECKTEEIIFVNQKGKEFLGIRESLLPCHLGTIFKGEGDHRDVITGIYQILLEEQKHSIENILVETTDGVQFYCNVEVGFVDEKREVIFVVFKSNEEKRNLLNSLVAERSLFQAVQSFSSDLLFRLNLKTKVIQYAGRLWKLLICHQL